MNPLFRRETARDAEKENSILKFQGSTCNFGFFRVYFPELKRRTFNQTKPKE